MADQFIDNAISVGRRYQSPETGMIHFSENGSDPLRHDLIPLYENALFALALIRSRKSETVEEGRALLSRVLGFQTASGDFPLYLHEYPKIRTEHLQARLLPVFYLLAEDEKQFLGKTLLEQLEKAARLLLAAQGESVPGGFVRALSFAASLSVWGGYLGDEALKKQGAELLNSLAEESKDSSFGTWYCPELIGETYAALQLIDPELNIPLFSHFLPFLEGSYSFKQKAFALPAVKLEQRGYEPLPTLYDLVIGQLTDCFSYRSYDSLPFQLRGALLRKTKRRLSAPPLPLHLKQELAGARVDIWQEETFSVGALSLSGPIPNELKRFFHPFRLLFGEAFTHSLVCQGGRISRLETVRVNGGFDLDLWLVEEPPVDDREKSHELLFFVDRVEDLSLTISGLKATAFNLGDEVIIDSPAQKIAMRFHLLEGDGRFMGHLTPGNRPAQILGQVGAPFVAHDWMIYLRTVRRSTAQHLKVEIRIS